MRNFCCGLILSLATGFLFSCGSKSDKKKFFDIPGYFRNEIEYIPNHFSTIEKTTGYNGHVDSTKMKSSEINWKKELGIFLECDINKPIYYSSLKSIPTPALDTNYHSVKYESQAVQTNIQMIEIRFKETSAGDLATYVEIKIKRSNLINATNITAVYAKDAYYRIEGDQKIKHLGRLNTFRVEGLFIK